MIIRKLLKEASKRQDSKNSHQWHFEDLVVSDREDVEEINDKLNRFKRKLEGDKDAGLNLTNKIDGAPAVVIWHKFPGLPDNSICLKTFMGKNPHVLSSVEDIQREKPYVADKLIPCLELAKYIPAGQAWQGDCLFSKEDLKERKINGKKYLTFLPNTLIYAFGEDNPNYERVKNADFGIAFHTIYTGEVGNLSQSFKVKASDINAPDRFYILSPALSRELDKKDFDTKAIDDLQNKFNSQASKLLSDPAYDIIINNKDLKWAEFENSIIRDKRNPHIDVNTFIEELKEYIANKLEKEYSKKTFKTDKGRENALLKKNDSIVRLSNTVEENKQTLINMVNCLNTVIDIKMLLLNGFRKYKTDYDTFYHKLSSDEYIPGAPEGEGIAMSDDDGNIVKLVDRPHFSHYNSSNDYESGFMKEELDLYEAFKLFEGIDDKTAVLIYGKFNPPTKAHRAMMEIIADKAREVNGDAFVYPSLKSGDEKHPMSYAQKLKWVKKAFGDILTVVESDAKNPYEALHDLYEKGYQSIIFFAGPDRSPMITKIPEYNTTKNDKLRPSDYFKFKRIEVNTEPLPGFENIRATYARNAVANNDFEAFCDFVPFNEKDAKELFDELRATMGLNEELLREAKIPSKAADRKHLKTIEDAKDYFNTNGGSLKYGISEDDLEYIYSLGYSEPLMGDYGYFGYITFTHEVENSSDERLNNIIKISRNTGLTNSGYHSGMKNVSQGNVESLIADAFNNINDISKPYHKVAKILANNIGTDIKLYKLETKDGSNVTPEWLLAGAYGDGHADRTPKTDLISNDTDNRYKISLKKAGGSQLMSGKFSDTGSEALATLNVVIDSLGKEYSLDKILEVSPSDDNINGVFNINQVLRSFYEDEDLYNKSVVISKVKNRDIENTDISEWEKNQTRKLQDISKKLNLFAAKLQNLCDNDESFKKAFMKEAATGDFKFGENSRSAANCWFVYSSNNAEFYENWEDFYSGYLNKHKIKILVNFKNAGAGKSAPYITIRVLEG